MPTRSAGEWSYMTAAINSIRSDSVSQIADVFEGSACHLHQVCCFMTAIICRHENKSWNNRILPMGCQRYACSLMFHGKRHAIKFQPSPDERYDSLEHVTPLVCQACSPTEFDRRCCMSQLHCCTITIEHSCFALRLQTVVNPVGS